MIVTHNYKGSTSYVKMIKCSLKKGQLDSEKKQLYC